MHCGTELRLSPLFLRLRAFRLPGGATSGTREAKVKTFTRNLENIIGFAYNIE